MAYQYTYVGLDNIIRDISDSQLNFVGGWSAVTKYYPRDVAIYRGTRYICLAASQGQLPPTTTVRNSYWSILALVSNGTSSSEDRSAAAYSLASQAYVLAVTGTEQVQAVQEQLTAVAGRVDQVEVIATTGTNLAKAAYDTAVAALKYSGTSSGGGDGPIAYEALSIATTGTNVASQAYGLATYAISLAGTSAGGDTSGTIFSAVIDLNGDDYQTLFLNGTMSITTTNRAPARSVTVRTVAAGTNNVFVFPSNWRWLSDIPSTINARTEGYLALVCFGVGEADIRAAYAPEDGLPSIPGNDGPVAYEALGIAIQGTNVASQAYGLATYAISLSGTTAGGGSTLEAQIFS